MRLNQFFMEAFAGEACLTRGLLMVSVQSVWALSIQALLQALQVQALLRALLRALLQVSQHWALQT